MVKARKMEKTSQDVQVHPNQMYARGNDKDACMTVQMNFELVGEDGLWFGRLDVVPAEAPVGTHAGRLGQCVRSVGVSLPFELSDSMNCLMQHLLQTSISLKLVLIKHYTVASLGFGEGTITTSDPLLIIGPVLSLPLFLHKIKFIRSKLSLVKNQLLLFNNSFKRKVDIIL
ncbi:hypothetical protein F2Q69_00020262 [Brassica cretica]|uniref:Uncharacterized protein n=1 Tax=Brassica cretica TaxID=69181 RepID=A0A8S9QII3_BRACR|nr:hypothetical protein F2Q69_00020262 [Brassica cretica]